MSQRDRTHLNAFAVAAGAVMIGAGLIAMGATDNDHRRRPPPGAMSERVARVVVGQATTLPPPPRPGPRPSTASATRTARRFAASWQDWDTGRRSPHAAAVLKRLSVAALWERLCHQRARPTAVRPAVSLAFESVRAIASGRGLWRTPLVAPHGSRYLGTLVVVTTPAGPRVAAVDP